MEPTEVIQAGSSNSEALTYDALKQISIVFYYTWTLVCAQHCSHRCVGLMELLLTHFYSEVLTWSLMGALGPRVRNWGYMMTVATTMVVADTLLPALAAEREAPL